MAHPVPVLTKRQTPIRFRDLPIGLIIEILGYLPGYDVVTCIQNIRGIKQKTILSICDYDVPRNCILNYEQLAHVYGWYLTFLHSIRNINTFAPKNLDSISETLIKSRGTIITSYRRTLAFKIPECLKISIRLRPLPLDTFSIQYVPIEPSSGSSLLSVDKDIDLLAAKVYQRHCYVRNFVTKVNKWYQERGLRSWPDMLDSDDTHLSLLIFWNAMDKLFTIYQSGLSRRSDHIYTPEDEEKIHQRWDSFNRSINTTFGPKANKLLFDIFPAYRNIISKFIDVFTGRENLPARTKDGIPEVSARAYAKYTFRHEFSRCLQVLKTYPIDTQRPSVRNRQLDILKWNNIELKLDPRYLGYSGKTGYQDRVISKEYGNHQFSPRHEIIPKTMDNKRKPLISHLSNSPASKYSSGSTLINRSSDTTTHDKENCIHHICRAYSCHANGCHLCIDPIFTHSIGQNLCPTGTVLAGKVSRALSEVPDTGIHGPQNTDSLAETGLIFPPKDCEVLRELTIAMSQGLNVNDASTPLTPQIAPKRQSDTVESSTTRIQHIRQTTLQILDGKLPREAGVNVAYSEIRNSRGSSRSKISTRNLSKDFANKFPLNEASDLSVNTNSPAGQGPSPCEGVEKNTSIQPEATQSLQPQSRRNSHAPKRDTIDSAELEALILESWDKFQVWLESASPLELMLRVLIVLVVIWLLLHPGVTFVVISTLLIARELTGHHNKTFMVSKY
ncbi:hypothetical protein H072_7710 [Dactylellina haptotyla CBS 200.50]|uniref:F-box domain-containing protein n=1 Tax=Dactylellina haptotyla (strain CBS 200.50) TaxID=1284197 RepID=S8BGW6_DACHA|nr:hypothetical protein H072_7710 [Dactylellina haptotyla CBS 200.50]